MKRPAFQFYPGDWRANANLRRCSHYERGVWIDVMCLMHDSDGQYGVLRWPLAEIAQAVNCKPADLAALRRKGVLKGAGDGETCEAFVYVPRSGGRDGEPVTLVPEQAGPVWFSSRMVRDEYVRLRRGEGARFTSEDNPQPKKSSKGVPKGGFGGDKGHGPSSSSSSLTADPSLRSGSSSSPPGLTHPASRAIPDVPTSWAEWSSWWRTERGVEVDPSHSGDRKRFLPMAERWIAAGVSGEQMRRALARAEAEAREPIAYLPAYVDRVLASSQAPPRTTALEEQAEVLHRITGGFHGRAPTDPRTIDVDSQPEAPRIATGGR